MLASSFLTAEKLGISQEEIHALIAVMYMLEGGELNASPTGTMACDKHEAKTLFLESFFEPAECGTVGCIAGWAHIVSGGKAFPELASLYKVVSEEKISGAACCFRHTNSDLVKMSMRLPDEAARLFRMIHTLGWKERNPSAESLATAIRNYLTTGNMHGET